MSKHDLNWKKLNIYVKFIELISFYFYFFEFKLSAVETERLRTQRKNRWPCSFFGGKWKRREVRWRVQCCWRGPNVGVECSRNATWDLRKSRWQKIMGPGVCWAGRNQKMRARAFVKNLGDLVGDTCLTGSRGIWKNNASGNVVFNEENLLRNPCCL